MAGKVSFIPTSYGVRFTCTGTGVLRFYTSYHLSDGWLWAWFQLLLLTMLFLCLVTWLPGRSVRCLQHFQISSSNARRCQVGLWLCSISSSVAVCFTSELEERSEVCLSIRGEAFFTVNSSRCFFKHGWQNPTAALLSVGLSRVCVCLNAWFKNKFFLFQEEGLKLEKNKVILKDWRIFLHCWWAQSVDLQPPRRSGQSRSLPVWTGLIHKLARFLPDLGGYFLQRSVWLSPA